MTGFKPQIFGVGSDCSTNRGSFLGQCLWHSWQSGRFRPGFESSHRQFLLNIYLLLTVYIEKTKNKEKEAGNDPFFKKRKAVTSFSHPRPKRLKYS